LTKKKNQAQKNMAKFGMKFPRPIRKKKKKMRSEIHERVRGKKTHQQRPTKRSHRQGFPKRGGRTIKEKKKRVRVRR